MLFHSDVRKRQLLCTIIGALLLIAPVAIAVPCDAVPSKNAVKNGNGAATTNGEGVAKKDSDPPNKEANSDITEFSFRSHIYGPCRAHLSKDRARFEWGMIIFLLTPPDYNQLYIVNPSNKCYKKQPMIEFLKERWGEWKHNPKIEKVKKIAEFTGHDLQCKRYSCITDGIECEFSTTEALGVKPQLADACCRFVGLPPGYGIPISATKLYSPKQILQAGHHAVPSRLKPVRGKMVNPWLVVRSITKSRLKEKDLKLSPDYKLTNEDFALWFSKDGSLNANDLEEFYTTGPDKLTSPKQKN